MSERPRVVLALAALAAWCALAAACAPEPATQLIVRIASDMDPGTEVTAVRITFTREGESMGMARTFALSRTTNPTLPGEVTFVPHSASDARRVLVELEATIGLQMQPGSITQRAAVTLRPGRSLVLHLVLARRCAVADLADDCLAHGLSCGWAGCEPIERDALPERTTSLDDDRGYGCPMCDGRCADVLSDPRNCGTCGTACPTVRSVPGGDAVGVCLQGVCRLSCEPDRGDCNRNLRDGCEARLADDPNNCGHCGIVCAANGQPTRVCANAQCGVTCDDVHGDCNGDYTDGCEVDLMTDANHCGGCHAVCLSTGSDSATCTDGTCIRFCNPGFAECVPNSMAHCQTDLRSDDAHCGACGHACAPGTRCVNSACVVP